MPTEALFASPRVRRILHVLGGTNYVNTHIAYQHFLTRDPALTLRLQALQSDRYLLTNGSHGHAVAATHALGVYPYLRGIVHANSGVGLKPQAGPYDRIEQLVRAHRAAHVPPGFPAMLPPIVFFDDRVENLEYPKSRGWTTVWICPLVNDAQPTFVDYVFPNVYVALDYFVMLRTQYRA